MAVFVAGCGDHTVPRSPCPPSLINCGGECVDLLADLPSHCGTCFTRCECCQQGRCPYCCPPLVACAGACVDLQSDNTNCGNCGVACDTMSGFSCVGSACSCIGGFAKCSGKCVNFLADSTNCGVCGNACTGGGVCAAGTCTCPTALPTLCSGVCVNLQSDGKNCGTCGNQCPAGGCVAGICAPSPTTLQVSCPQSALPAGSGMQCTATGMSPGGSLLPLTNVVTWSAVNHGACASAAGTISNGPPSTQPIGTFTAITAGCTSDVSATYTPAGGTPLTSNTVTVMVTS